MAATYDPNPRAPLGFRIPFNADSGVAISERLRNWNRHPINLVGSRQLSQRLADAGIKHQCEEFDDDHSDIDYRMDVSLPFLYRALKG